MRGVKNGATGLSETAVRAITPPGSKLGGMAITSTCRGCQLELAATGLEPSRWAAGSPECELLYGELIGFEMSHLAQLGRFHQLSVDAYGAQHPTTEGSGIRRAYSLVGLHLALDRGYDGLRVRTFHQSMGKPQPGWPNFVVPATRGGLTVRDVVEAGARKDSVNGHAEVVQEWAKSVWMAWSAERPRVETLVASLATTDVRDRS